MSGKIKSYGLEESSTGITLAVDSFSDTDVGFIMYPDSQRQMTFLTYDEVTDLVAQLQGWLNEQAPKLGDYV